jgi:hypothetical protein
MPNAAYPEDQAMLNEPTTNVDPFCTNIPATVSSSIEKA